MGTLNLSGSESISRANMTVQDFWSWAYSDILSNRNRSIFAEFLVAVALGLTHQPRVEWDEVDLRYEGKRIEVKSSAYLQSWQQKRLSALIFDIAEKRGWDSLTNLMGEEVSRNSDCYVFCVYREKNRENLNVLDLDQWSFLVIATERINTVFGHQKSVAFSRLQPLGTIVPFDELKDSIDSVLGQVVV